MPDGPAQVTLLGFTIPDGLIQEILVEDPGMPVQTHTFAWALVDALSRAGHRVTLLSTMPVSTYPRSRRVLLKGGGFTADAVEGHLLGFVNLFGLKHLTRFLNAFQVGLPAIARWRSRVLLIHGVHTPFLWFGVLARALRGLVVVPVLTDPPGVAQPGDGAVIRLLRTIDVFLVTSALRRCDGAVALTPALARDFAPDRPWLLMDGILRTPQQVAAASQQPPRRARCTFDVVYAGGLTRAYGVSRLVEAVRGLDDPAVRLLTYGRGELEPWLREQSAEDDRIRPPELLPRSELIRRLVAADVLVNPRPVNQGFVNYSFPSKLIEYLSTGTPVITTRLPAISSEYEGRLLFADPDTVAGLRAAISQVRTMPPEAACAPGLAGANLVQSTRSAEAQGTRISCFLSTLLERSEHTGQDREQGKGKPRSRR